MDKLKKTFKINIKKFNFMTYLANCTCFRKTFYNETASLCSLPWSVSLKES